MARLNINVNEKLLSQLRIIAAVQDKTVTDIVVELITAYVRDKKKDALAATSEILADRNADADKTVEEHLMPKNLQITDGGKQPEKTLDSNEPQQVTDDGKPQLDDADTLRQKATQFKDLIATAKNGQRYLLKKQKTTINGLDTKYPVFADGKQHPAYLLPADLQEATESPTNDGNKS